MAGDDDGSRLEDPRSIGRRCCALDSGRGGGAYVCCGVTAALSMIRFLTGEDGVWLPLGLSCRSMLVSVSKVEKID